ncbi:MAG: response regulator [Myxococcota bacterium]
MSQRDAIICVDDEPLVLKALLRALRRGLGRAFAIETASNGAEALALIEQLGRDDTTTRMVVSDAKMPVMDGYELIEQLHHARPHVHKILLTGQGDKCRIERLFSSRACSPYSTNRGTPGNSAR